MTNKADKAFAEDFLHQFAKFMTIAANQQSTFWQQMEFSQLNRQQQEQFFEECQSRFQEYLQGLQLYQDIAGQRDVTEPPVIWAMGSARLLDYSQTTDSKAPVLLVVPSLINRAYILDLTEELSFLRQLAKKGIRPFLLDWGSLSDQERHFSLEDYMSRLLVVLDHLKAYTQSSVSMLGYCMGGLFVTASAQLRPDIEKLILIGTPWDFHAGHEWLIPWIQASTGYIEQTIDQAAEMPIELIQYIFAISNPVAVIRKFRKLPTFSDDLKRLQEFANVEDWLNDCVPLASKVAKECLFGWYRDNTTSQSKWKIFDQIIDPRKLKQSALFIIPQTDKVVPIACAEALAAIVPRSDILRPPTGHVGAVVGKSATSQVLPAIEQFLISGKQSKN